MNATYQSSIYFSMKAPYIKSSLCRKTGKKWLDRNDHIKGTSNVNILKTSAHLMK